MTENGERVMRKVGFQKADRAELARLSIESFDDFDDTGVEAAWDAELLRRAEQGKSRLRPAHHLLAEITYKYNGVECFRY